MYKYPKQIKLCAENVRFMKEADVHRLIVPNDTWETRDVAEYDIFSRLITIYLI